MISSSIYFVNWRLLKIITVNEVTKITLFFYFNYTSDYYKRRPTSLKITKLTQHGLYKKYYRVVQKIQLKQWIPAVISVNCPVRTWL